MQQLEQQRRITRRFQRRGDVAGSGRASASTADCKAAIGQGALSGSAVDATCEYLGIPYGAPPVGPLRFMPPQPAAGWGPMVRDTTKFGPECLQAPGLTSVGGAGLPAPSEDCLSVNVFTPKAAPAELLPVMVFIYGGAFTSGASSQYDARGLLSERGPVVLFDDAELPPRRARVPRRSRSSTRERPGSPVRLGRDPRPAARPLQWVKDNIATFHGDPNNVTVFGESAGSMSTCIHMVSPGSQGLAKNFILGERLLRRPGGSRRYEGERRVATSQLLASTYCSDGRRSGLQRGRRERLQRGRRRQRRDGLPAPRRRQHPRDLAFPPPARRTTRASRVGDGEPPWSPVLARRRGSGAACFPDLPANLIAQGKSTTKDASIIAGTNKNEFGLFGGSREPRRHGAGPGTSRRPPSFDTDIATLFGSNAAAVEAQYPATDATANATFVTLVTDYVFRCPTRDLARAATGGGTKNFFLYSYEVGHAWHSDELLALFKVTGLGLLGGTTPSAAFQSTMQGYWTELATQGDPNASSVGGGDAAAPVWPKYDTTSDQNLVLTDPTPTTETGWQKADCDFWDTFEAAHDGG